MEQPLSGKTIIDVTTVLAGSYCTMLLGDMGANVIKIEPLSGDSIRKSPPFVGGESTYFLYTNRNKRSITVNLREEEGRNILLKLVKTADIFVENYKPQTKKRLRIDYPELKNINAKLIYCSISAFGQKGPFAENPGFDQIAQGMSGLMSVTGFPNSPPTRVGVAIGDTIASLFAIYGVLAAFIEAERTGMGQYVETSLLEGLIAVLGFQAAKYFGTGEVPMPQGNDHATYAPYGTYRTKDGYINIAAGTERMWVKLCEIIEREDLIDDLKFKTMSDRIKNKNALRAELETKLTQKITDEWVKILNQAEIAAGPIYNIDQVFKNEHVLAREMLNEIQHPLAGKIKNIGFPLKMERTPCQIKYPPPCLGEHTYVILKELNYSESEIQRLQKDGVV
ncbi:MAG: CoA transferase [Deltaproteobacteria bacterium]|nr:CoA transferase [Deltaproteobacteria bacterium]